MTTDRIYESGMSFGPYAGGLCFYVEKSQLYLKITNDVKMVEFMLIKHRLEKFDSVWMIEAKSSTPQPATAPNFDDFICEICEKMTNSLSLLFSVVLGRHENSGHDMPESFLALDMNNIGVRFVLVVKGHKDEWLPPIRDALGKKLRATEKLWELGANSISVLNERLAIKHGLIFEQI